MKIPDQQFLRYHVNVGSDEIPQTKLVVIQHDLKLNHLQIIDQCLPDFINQSTATKK